MEGQRITGMGVFTIFWIMIIVIFICARGAAKRVHSSGKGSYGGKKDRYGAGTSPTSPERWNGSAAGGFQAERKNKTAVSNGIKTRAAVSERPQTAAGRDASEEGSTLDYLADKAEEDRIQHERQERERSLRREQEAARGGYVYAGRIPDNGVLKPGERVVVCGYCGAENVLPNNASGRYNCYFCREELMRG